MICNFFVDRRAFDRRFERPTLSRCWETNKGEVFVIMNALLVP